MTRKGRSRLVLFWTGIDISLTGSHQLSDDQTTEDVPRYLYQLLRPELVERFFKVYGKRLSPDSFSKFETNPEESNAEIKQATKFLLRVLTQCSKVSYLLKVVIPKFARKLVAEECFEPATPWNFFIQLLHRYGINCRHLGRVFKEVQGYCTHDFSRLNDQLGYGQDYNTPNPVLTSIRPHFWRKIVFTEMVSRITKCELRARMQKSLYCSGGEISAGKMAACYLSQLSVITEVINYFNVLFGATETTKQCWMNLLFDKLPNKFKGFSLFKDSSFLDGNQEAQVGSKNESD